MVNPRKIKVILAIILLLSILLPLSSCTHYTDPDGSTIHLEENQKLPDNAQKITTYNYVLSNFDAGALFSWLLILCYTWPIPILIHRYKSKREKLKKVIWFIEPLLLIGSSVLIHMAANVMSTALAIGTYLAISANSAYGIVWLQELISKIKKKKEAVNA
jgi:hypothetical protein